jgi:hypothetical protein
VLFVSSSRATNGRGRWLAFGATLVVSAAMFYAQNTETPCCDRKPTAAAPSASPVAHQQPAPPAQPPPQAAPLRVASPAELKSLTADAPTAAQSFQFSLPAGVAPENGLQVKTIWAARAISLLFPQITTIGGYRQDALKWHPNGLAIDVMIPNHNSPEGIELGDQIAGYALANAKRWGVDHVIWRQKIYPGIGKPSWTANLGNETANHYDHVHETYSIGSMSPTPPA